MRVPPCQPCAISAMPLDRARMALRSRKAGLTWTSRVWNTNASARSPLAEQALEEADEQGAVLAHRARGIEQQHQPGRLRPGDGGRPARIGVPPWARLRRMVRRRSGWAPRPARRWRRVRRRRRRAASRSASASTRASSSGSAMWRRSISAEALGVAGAGAPARRAPPRRQVRAAARSGSPGRPTGRPALAAHAAAGRLPPDQRGPYAAPQPVDVEQLIEARAVGPAAAQQRLSARRNSAGAVERTARAIRSASSASAEAEREAVIAQEPEEPCKPRQHQATFASSRSTRSRGRRGCVLAGLEQAEQGLLGRSPDRRAGRGRRARPGPPPSPGSRRRPASSSGPRAGPPGRSGRSAGQRRLDPRQPRGQDRASPWPRPDSRHSGRGSGGAARRRARACRCWSARPRGCWWPRSCRARAR